MADGKKLEFVEVLTNINLMMNILIMMNF